MSASHQLGRANDAVAPSLNRACRHCGSERAFVRRGPGEGVGYRLVCTTCNAERLREKRATDAGYSAAKNAKWQAAHPEKRRAHKVVERAIASGSLIRKPCERCGSTVRIEAHHDDYSRPLEIMWLCRTHHLERHRELRCADAA